ncbi:hypothetical protein T459_22043 [Capsicum annuum]|uniref:Ubiquitin-like protease family profile domain-containing protein n=1 Tax=Capsicum annuum TaxID=4072 RepID=A0A2G2YYF4_CAPAN|nr:hypothetical protein T459_22043 [Capsicum annuum]
MGRSLFMCLWVVSQGHKPSMGRSQLICTGGSLMVTVQYSNDYKDDKNEALHTQYIFRTDVPHGGPAFHAAGTVDNIIIPVNVNESFHWILVVFRIRHRCLYVYDSMMGGTVHSKNVLDYVRSLSTMIPMFLVATNFYEKQSDIDWYREAAYIDKALSESLEYVILKDTPHDYGMFVCTFAEYVSHDMFDISSRLFGVVNHRLRYGALLWDYARRKQNDGAISESEATENVTRKHGCFKRSREQFGSSRTR